MLLHGLLSRLVDGQQSLAGTPVHLANELATECVDDTGNRGLGALADEVKVQHALNGSGLETVDKASSLVGEKSVLGERAQWPARSRETLDVVVGREAAGRGGSHGKSRGRS